VLERFESPDGLFAYRSPELARIGVPHAFTTRAVTTRAGETLAGELDVGPLDAALTLRLARLAGAGEEASAVDLRQVHGAEVREVDGGPFGTEQRADGLVTRVRGQLLVIRTADCVPVLLARSDGGRVAAVHAGWRGLVAGVIPRALEVLGAGEWAAAIGPCISSARFEVGPEVRAAFEHAGLESAVRSQPMARPHVDLRAAAAIQLERGGVRRIDTSDRCTYEHADEFYSYRRDVSHGTQPRTGRLAALIAIA
jgi:YfiH family protein